MVTALPITMLIFIVSGVRAFRTHGCSFDSIVLFLCAGYNALYIFRGCIICENSIQLATIIYMTAMILYLYTNFEKVIDNMEREMRATKKGVSYTDTTGLTLIDTTYQNAAAASINVTAL